MPRTWLGWAALFIVGVLLWKHPGSLGHAINGLINRISIFFDSL